MPDQPIETWQLIVVAVAVFIYVAAMIAVWKSDNTR